MYITFLKNPNEIWITEIALQVWSQKVLDLIKRPLECTVWHLLYSPIQCLQVLQQLILCKHLVVYDNSCGKIDTGSTQYIDVFVT